MLNLHDSLTKEKRPFTPRVEGRVSVYNCGPTVYNYAHIGNLRTFLFADLLRRYLDFSGYEVHQVMNITDVGHMLADADEGEDKMEVAAKEAGKTPEEVAAFFTEAFMKDIDRLGFRKAHEYPHASEHVPGMIAIIEALLEKGHAYKVEHDGGVSVYYDVASFPAYGKLSGNRVDDLDAGARVDVRSEKKHPADFALWIHNPKHLMQWEAPWGKGYPGWHIECSAMAREYLGDSIDIHTGGEDNRFPHHECEIAQSEGATGKPFAGYWLHVTHLMVDGEKMAKSKGNFYTLQDLIDRGHDPRAVRYLLMSTHYRQSLNFTLSGLDGAAASLARLDDFTDAVRHSHPSEKGDGSPRTEQARTIFLAALDDDFNISEALAALFGYVTDVNAALAAGDVTEADVRAAETFMQHVGDILGFRFGRQVGKKDIPADILEKVEARQLARAEKRFADADRLREDITAAGYILEDGPTGPIVKRA